MALPKLHASTIVFLILVAAVILLANIPGQIVEGPVIEGGDPDELFGQQFCLDWTCCHGWPFTFLVREEVNPGTSPQRQLSLWNLAEGVVQCSWPRLTGDVLIGLPLLVIAGTGFEYWRRRRGRIQLHLIDILVAFALVACGLSYWATNANERKRQELAVERLEASEDYMPAKGSLSWSKGGPTWLRNWLGDRRFAAFDRVIEIHVYAEGLSHLPDLRNLKHIYVDSSSRTLNQQIDTLRDLPELEALNLPNMTTYDAKQNSLDYNDDPDVRLPPMPHLRGLSMFETKFHGEGLEYLIAIEVLDVSYTEVGDDAMPKFEAMRNLKSLSLAGTDVTDMGLEHLQGLSNLRELWLDQTKVTAEGIKKLRQALPNCKITRGSPRRGQSAQAES